MKITMKVNIGKNVLAVECDKMSDIHKFGSTYGSLPDKCDRCGSKNIYLSYKNPKENDYFTIACGDCTADANFGIRKDGKGLFWKGEKMTKYGDDKPGTEGQATGQSSGQSSGQNPGIELADGDDVAF